MIVRVFVAGVACSALIDTGATVCPAAVQVGTDPG
jgi:hypothetical protein